MSFDESCYSKTFFVVIFANLGCGLCFVTIGAFFAGETRTSTLVIFGLYLIYSLWMVYIIGKEVVFTKDNVDTSSITWISGMNAVITTLVIGAVFVLVIPTIPGELALLAGGLNLGLLIFAGCCYSTFLLANEEQKLDERNRQVRKVLHLQSSLEEGNGDRGKSQITVEQSLAKMMNHVQTNPLYKTYTLHTGMNEYGRPFQVVMQV